MITGRYQSSINKGETEGLGFEIDFLGKKVSKGKKSFLIKCFVWLIASSHCGVPRSLGQSKKFQAVKGRRQPHILGLLVHKGCDHLDDRRQTAGFVPLEGTVAVQIQQRPLRKPRLDVLGQLRGAGVRVHEGRIGFHQQALEREAAVLEQLAHAGVGFVLA